MINFGLKYFQRSAQNIQKTKIFDFATSFSGVPIGLELNFYVCKYDLNLADTVVLYHVKIQDFDQSYKNSYKFILSF